ncbi:hypothetical protein GIB67_007399 [Kingdonia uniflora]|uniref:Uncharacterized protein n=1 Tax=Kingdonia uniflora TaxID=39325 RepID=A0A7J7MLQ7_9MAGN|nr:hypothetical protein GIB67_007399 [Kingdonia uniflora]
MASKYKKEQQNLSEIKNNNNYSVDVENQTDVQMTITSHLYLKPTHTSEPMDKDVVLRRIRQRKRVYRFRNALQAILSSPFSRKNEGEKKWLDDAFSAPW